VRELLGLGGSGPNRSVLEAGGYEEVEHAQWFAWTRTTIVTGGQRPELPFKLYLSPRPECLPDVFSRTIDVLVGCGAGSLKVGRTAQNLLRPDKLLIYVETHAALLTLAAELQRSLKGFAAQGVPFTCGVDADGLLSWGSDPPRLASFPGWTQAESWRSCIADRLAVGLLQARAQSCAEPWRFALEKLRLEGIDTCRWAPQGDGEYQPDASAGR
jgi:hypothetical protein